jgi:adenylate kinase
MDNLSPLRVYITGVPATGKTAVAKNLSDSLLLNYLEINSVVLDKGLFFGYDINRDSVIIDDELLTQELNAIITKENRLCLVGPIIPLKNVFDFIIVLHCGITTLRQRFSARDYSENKIEENIEAEIMNIIYYDSIEFYSEKKVIEVHNDERTIEETCNEIISIISQHHPSVLK